MNNMHAKQSSGKGSIVIENHDLIADIEQDRFIAHALGKRHFIFGRFPTSLENLYRDKNYNKRLKRMVEVMIFALITIVGCSIYQLMQGEQLQSLQSLAPTLVVIGVGIALHKSKALSMIHQVFIVLVTALLGFGIQSFIVQMLEQAHPWMLAFAVIMLVFASRASLEFPTLLFMALASSVVWFQPESMITSAFYFSLFTGSALILWVWREDADRRQFLQLCASPNAGARGTAPVKETERARQLVVLDKETGLANSSSFMRFFTNEWQRAFRARQSLSLVLIALDVNIDKLVEHGHLNLVLTELQRYSRRPGDLVGKMDDCSFAVLLSNTDIGNSRRLAESLLEHLHGLDLGKDGSLKVFMGVASTLPMPSMTHEDLYAKAKDALEAAQKKT